MEVADILGANPSCKLESTPLTCIGQLQTIPALFDTRMQAPHAASSDFTVLTIHWSCQSVAGGWGRPAGAIDCEKVAEAGLLYQSGQHQPAHRSPSGPAIRQQPFSEATDGTAMTVTPLTSN
jgi:hypothetical protein